MGFAVDGCWVDENCCEGEFVLFSECEIEARFGGG
jgi:hypothetical protein